MSEAIDSADMSENDFMFSVNTLVGCRYPILKDLERKHRVDKEFRKKYRGTKWLSRLITTLSYFDQVRYRSLSKGLEVTKPPIYVVGHWRSGTTLIHGLLCSSKNVSYPTTYQSVFPNNLFSFNWLIKNIMQSILPERRLVDHVKMHVDYPQEEDFALGNEAGFSFYYWFYFPKDWRYFSDHFLTLSAEEKKLREKYARSYLRFVKRSILNVGGEQYIAKNPPSLARIPFLLQLFPEARFLYIERNPYEVLTSTFRFFKSFLVTLQLQEFDDESLWEFILYNYKFLHHRYREDRLLIPEKQLVEIKYEQLIKDPVKMLKTLQKGIFSDLETDREKLGPLIKRHKSHTLKKYEFDQAFIERVNMEIGDLITDQGYPLL